METDTMGILGVLLAVVASAISLALLTRGATNKLDGRITELRGEVGKVRTELGGEVGKVRTEMGGEIGKLRTELGGEIGKVRSELRRRDRQGALGAEAARSARYARSWAARSAR